MFKELPKTAVGIVTNNRTADSHYGKPEVIDLLLKIGELWAATRTTPISIGPISRKNGERFPPHRAHRQGIEVDIRPMRKDGRNLPVFVGSKMYDAAQTRDLVQMLRMHAKVKLILFNDSGMVKDGLTRHYPNHSNHLHVRFDY